MSSQENDKNSSVSDSIQFVSCSNCFKNLGISVEAKKLGKEYPGECPRCGTTAGAKLNSEQSRTLQINFFLGGSHVTTYYPPPIGMGGAKLSPSQFEPNTWEDYLVLKELTGIELFWHGPRLWRLGHSLLREKVLARLKPAEHEWPRSVGQDTSLSDLWDEAISIVKPTLLREGEKVFRARTHAENPLKILDYDSPPLPSIQPNRFNDSTHQVFYGACDVETCLIELKLGPNELVRNDVTVARFALKRSLNVLNLCDISRGELEHGAFIERMALLTGLLFPRDADYFITQSLSRHIEDRGFDGILHPSAFQSISKVESRNLVIFGAPVKDGRIELLDVNRVAIGSLRYDLRFGPACKQ